MRCTKNFEDSLILYLLIGMAGSNFLGRGSIVFLLLCIYFVFCARPQNIHFNVQAGWAALLSATCIPAVIMFYGVAELLKVPIFLGAYLVGYCGYRLAEDKIIFIKRTVFSVYAGFSANIVLTYFYNLNRMVAGSRRIYDFWTKETSSATLFGLLSSVVIGYSFYGLFFSKRKLNKLLSGGVLVISLMLNLSSATRTPFLMLLVVYVTMVLLVLLNNKGLKGLKTFSVICVIFASVILLYNLNFFGVQDLVLQSPLLARLQTEGIETSRIDIVELYFEQMPNYLWGGGNIYVVTGRMAHNYLQDFYDMYGLIPFIALVGVSCYIVKHMMNLIILRQKTAVDFLLISMYLSMFLQMLLEPVFLGFPILFWCLVMIDAMTGAYLKERKAGVIE